MHAANSGSSHAVRSFTLCLAQEENELAPETNFVFIPGAVSPLWPVMMEVLKAEVLPSAFKAYVYFAAVERPNSPRKVIRPVIVDL